MREVKKQAKSLENLTQPPPIPPKEVSKTSRKLFYLILE